MLSKQELSAVCDIEMLSLALDLSRLAYHDGIITQYDEIEEFHAWYSSATAYLLRGEEYDALVFRGSKEPLDFLVDAMAVPVWCKGGWTHAGFAYSHWSLWHKIKKRIDRSKALLVCGHSLGGANADKAVDALEDHPHDLHMITFGKPNVHLRGQGPYRGHLATHLSVVSGSDIVTMLPRFLFAPHAAQNMLYFANDDTDRINPSIDERRSDMVIRELISDHSIELEYGARLGMLLENINNDGRATA